MSDSSEKKIVKGLPVIRQKKFGKQVWAHDVMDGQRREHCLCMNCDKMKPGEPDHCRIAQKGYELCVTENVAFMMTRCPYWAPKE